MRLSIFVNFTSLLLAVLVVARHDKSAEDSALTWNITVPTDTEPKSKLSYAPDEVDEDDLGHYTETSSPSLDKADNQSRARRKRARVKNARTKGKKAAPKGKTAAPKGQTPVKPLTGKKPSNNKTPPSGKSSSGKKAGSPYKSQPSAASTRQRPATGRLAISQALQTFNFVTAVRHEGTSDSTNTLSYDAMVRSEIPRLKIVRGSFKISRTALLKAKSTQAMQNVKTMVQSANLLKTQLDRGIAGEVDLTQVIQQAIGSTANMILDAVGKPKVHWHMTNLGSSPIPDIELSVAGLNSRKVAAVVEVKTPSSLTPEQVRLMFADIGKYKWEQMYHNNSHAAIAQMNYKKANWGVITNLDSWIVLNQVGLELSMTEVPAIVKGRSNALNIMLEVALHAIGL